MTATILNNTGEYDEFFGGFLDVTPSRQMNTPRDNVYAFENTGITLKTPIVIQTDAAPGCGGKIWEAGEMMCDYIIEKHADPSSKFHKENPSRYKQVIELGTGTGIVSLLLGQMHNEGFLDLKNVSATDITDLLPLLKSNIDSNQMSNIVQAKELWWGENIDENVFDLKNIDLILAADCVYHENLFDILIQTLLDLTALNSNIPILLAYKKRRKANKKFFAKLKKFFNVEDLKNFRQFEHARTHRLNMFLITRK